ncbi:MAG: hypothetical protein LBQ15_01245 [Clostridium sp.]|jgi:hypothetical protein|nr:hypothetical protein [Clostridium sp.]
MNDSGQDKVIAFDTLFTNHQIQMLKILMPYFDRSMQKNLAIYIKYLELQYTIHFFQNHPSVSLDPLPRESALDLPKLCDEILPYSSSHDRGKLEGMRNMFQSIARYKEMMEMMQMVKELFPEGEGSGEPDFLSGLGGMSGMAGFDPSQMAQMFQMFQTLQNTGGEPDKDEQTKPPGMDGG